MANNNRNVFWGNNPNILFSSFDIFPLKTMTFAEKINALTRMILLIMVILVIHFRQYPIISFISTMLFIYVISIYHIKEEGFIGIGIDETNAIKEPEKEPEKNTQEEKKVVEVETVTEKNAKMEKKKGVEGIMNTSMDKKNVKYQAPSSKNPFSNPLINDNPNKLPAPPISMKKVENDILINAKKMVQQMNRGQPNIADKLFKDLDEDLNFEQSLRPFYSTPNTTIPNDQGAFTEFCYGNMISNKEGNTFAAARNLFSHAIM